MSDSVRPHRWLPTRLPHPLGFSRQEHWSGCHFLLQCMKVKSESEVAQSCLTLSDPMGCSPPGSSVHGIFQARVLEWVAIAFSIYILLSRNYSLSVSLTNNLEPPNQSFSFPTFWLYSLLAVRQPYHVTPLLRTLSNVLNRGPPAHAICNSSIVPSLTCL